MTDNLQQAIAAIKSGDKATGKKLLAQVLKDDRTNENAWLWMTRAVDSPTEQIQCFQNVLKINPDNEHAKKGLARLQPLLPTPQAGPSSQPSHQDTPPPMPIKSEVVRPITPLPELPQENTSPVEAQPRPKSKVRSLSSSSNRLPTQPATRQCPYCAETIKAEAKICRFCNRDLTTGQSSVPAIQQVQPQIIVQAPPQREWSPDVAAVLSLILPGMGQLYKGQLGRGILAFLMTAVGYALFVLPGLIMHLIVIIDAMQGNPYSNSGYLGIPGVSNSSSSSGSSAILLVVIILAFLGLCIVCSLNGGGAQ